MIFWHGIFWLEISAWKAISARRWIDPMYRVLSSHLGSNWFFPAGLSWAFNTRSYFQQEYPEFDISLWLLACSLGGGGFGVFFGGWLSDRLVQKLGLHSRLWVLGAFQLLAAPWAALVLYLQASYWYQSCIKFKKLNLSSGCSVELKFVSLGRKLNLNCYATEWMFLNCSKSIMRE